MGEPDRATLLDAEEREGLLFAHVQTREQLNELEQVNIQSGLRWIRSRSEVDFFTERFVCDMHRKLFGDVWAWAGTFRKTGKNVGCEAMYIGVELKKLLDDGEYWVANKTYPATELALRFHYRLVTIHLFPNGNGRHARIMADVLLTHVLHVEPVDWVGGVDLESVSDHRKQYIKALRAADNGDFSLLLEFA